MTDNRYLPESSPDLFVFDSIGPGGAITKVIKYTELDVKAFLTLVLEIKIPRTAP